jgi:hypothetical protein
MSLGRFVGAFGPYAFYASADVVHTFCRGTRQRGAVFARHRVIGSKDRIEPIAPELDEVSLEVVLDQAHRVIPEALAILLNQLKELQGAWPLFVGPIYKGHFVITRIAENWERFGKFGEIERMIVSISFLEDADATAAVFRRVKRALA